MYNEFEHLKNKIMGAAIINLISKEVLKSLVPPSEVTEVRDGYLMNFKRIETLGYKKFKLLSFIGIAQTSDGRFYQRMEVRTKKDRYTRITLFASYENLLTFFEGDVVYVNALVTRKMVTKNTHVSPDELEEAMRVSRKKGKAIYHNLDLVLLGRRSPKDAAWVKVTKQRGLKSKYKDILWARNNDKDQGGAIYTSQNNNNL